MPEHRADQIARQPVCILILFPNPTGGVDLQFTQGHRHRLIVCLNNPPVIAHECRNGN
jgi:hypothetical protein